MKVIVTIAGIDPRFGGPSQTVPALCSALSAVDVAVKLITLANTDDNKPSRIETGYEQAIIRTRSNRYVPLGWMRAFRNEIARSANMDEPVVLYDVGLWLPSNHAVAKFARRTRIPLVVSPRGMLSSQALGVSKWKKRVAWQLFQKRNLKSARVLHATSAAEADDFRARGLHQPIAIIPNGVDVPPALPSDLRPLASLPSAFQNFSVSASRTRTLLFLSRLHPIKGLKDLAQAWARVRPPGWRVIIAGPNEEGHQSEIESLLQSLGVRGDFEFIGAVEQEKKWNLYRTADLFVLPSYSESFGQVIAEALASGLPVITTHATPWRELEEQRCGWWVPTGTDALATALTEATARTNSELQAMGERGHTLMATKYSWLAAAEKMKSVFEWVAGRQPAPTWVS